MEPLFELDLHLPGRGSRRLLCELHGQFKAAILDGRLTPGLQLPATRALAARLGISRNTVVAAYRLLMREGYVVARAGAGNFVSALLPEAAAPPSMRLPNNNDPRLSPYVRTLLRTKNVVSTPGPKFDFEVGVPDTTQFKFDVWNRLSTRSIRALSRNSTQRGDPQGHPELREAIARHVSITRAVACRAGSIVVTHGAQQAFDLLARTLVTPGRTAVAVERPGYRPPQLAFAAAGARIVPVRVDTEGLRVEDLPQDVGVISVSPSHQFPLGCVLSAVRRAALIAFVRQREAIVIEDDYDGEFRYGGRPLDSLQTLDRSESVFYIGTFTKSLFPALRIGFIVAPPWALPALIAARRSADRHGDVVTENTLADFIGEGHLARHVRKMRAIYSDRRHALLEGLGGDFERWLKPVPSAAGLHLATLMRPDIKVEAIVERALQVQVRISSIGTYGGGTKRCPRGLLFGYGLIDKQSIREGLARLHSIMPP